MDFQKIIDDINERSRIERGREYNLGNLIDDLEPYKESAKTIEFDDGSIPTSFESWRGVYNHLALGYDAEKELKEIEFASEIYRQAYNSNNSIFEGYKGGYFKMDRDTPIYQANYGEVGVGDNYDTKKIIGIKEEKNKVIILTRIDED